MDAQYADDAPVSASDRMTADLKWFEDHLAVEFPSIASGSADYTLAKYWYLAALQRCADHEGEVLAQVNTEIELALSAMRRALG